MKCFKCSKDGFDTLEMYMKHIDVYHKLETILECYTCSQKRLFSNKNSFRKHISRHFQASLQPSDAPAIRPNETRKVHSICTFDSVTSHSYENFQINLSSDIQNEIALKQINFVASLYAHKDVTKKSLQDIYEIYFSYFTADLLSICQKNIIENLGENISESSSMIINIFSELKKSFKNISTDYKRVAMLQKNHLVGKISSPAIGVRNDIRSRGNITCMENILVRAKILPIKHSLTKFLSNSSRLSLIISYIDELGNQEGFISNLLQTSFWKGIEKKFEDSGTYIPLIIYYDEFEVNNPLGSRAGFQSLGAVYVSILCVPDQMRSKLESIFLVMLFNSLDKKHYGNKIFQPLVDVLMDLEVNGIEINGKKIYFVVSVCTGDNKGINSILGFSEGFRSNYFCRFCKMHRNETQKALKPRQELLRTKQNIAEDFQLNEPTYTGIVDKCSFLDLRNFEVAVDIMHDFLEGILNFEIAYILKQFIYCDKLFSLNQLNERIRVFNYGKNNSHINKPPEINENHLKIKIKLRYSSSEMLIFSKILGIVIGDWVPENNNLWMVYKYLMDILEIVLLDAFDDPTIKRLEFLIFEHHQLYLKFFKVPLKPKHHFIIHYPDVIRKLGPVKHLWSMRFESKHKELKKIAVSTSSRKDICQTIAHRYILADQNMDNDSEGQCLSFGNEVKHIPEYVKEKLRGRHLNTKFFNWITYLQRKIKIGNIIQIGLDLYPQFARIDSICVFNMETVEIYVTELETLYFDEHKHVHKVAYKNKKQKLSLDDICFRYFTLIEFNNDQFLLL